MSEFSFHEENSYRTPNNQPPKQSWLVSLVIKLSGGKIKNTQQATVTLLVIAVLGFALTIYFMSQAGGPPPVEPGVNPATGERLPEEF
mgnify:CR=1 FL=1